MNKTEFERIVEAYKEVASKTGYRRMYGGDGLDLDEPKILEREAQQYAKEFMKQEDDLLFHIGVSNWSTNRALVYVIEAARALCGADNERANTLLKMATDEMKSVYKPMPKRKDEGTSK